MRRLIAGIEGDEDLELFDQRSWGGAFGELAKMDASLLVGIYTNI